MGQGVTPASSGSAGRHRRLKFQVVSGAPTRPAAATRTPVAGLLAKTRRLRPLLRRPGGGRATAGVTREVTKVAAARRTAGPGVSCQIPGRRRWPERRWQPGRRSPAGRHGTRAGLRVSASSPWVWGTSPAAARLPDSENRDPLGGCGSGRTSSAICPLRKPCETCKTLPNEKPMCETLRKFYLRGKLAKTCICETLRILRNKRKTVKLVFVKPCESRICELAKHGLRNLAKHCETLIAKIAKIAKIDSELHCETISQITKLCTK